MHYQEFRLCDPAVIAYIIGRWPFAATIVNGSERSVVLPAPLTLPQVPEDDKGFGSVEFHLAKAKPVMTSIGDSVPGTFDVQEPSAHVSLA